jgi:hypothetical protein
MIGQYQGVVKSLSNPDGPGLLAYYLSLKGRRGFLRLCTSEPFDPSTGLRTGFARDKLRAGSGQDRRELRLDIAANEARVTLGGQALGSIQLREGTIFDSQGQPVGHYQRYQGLRWQVGSAPMSSKYGPVELYGRTVAEVNDGLVRSGGLLTSNAASRPLIRNPSTTLRPFDRAQDRLRSGQGSGQGLVPDLTPEEESWLLALVALELYHSALRHRNRPHSF